MRSNSSYHPLLDAFNASLSLDGANQPSYAYIELSAVHATKQTTTYVNQTVQIINLDAFNAYSQQVLSREEYKLRFKGKAKLLEMRFPTTTVNYDKLSPLIHPLIRPHRRF